MIFQLTKKESYTVCGGTYKNDPNLDKYCVVKWYICGYTTKEAENNSFEWYIVDANKMLNSRCEVDADCLEGEAMECNNANLGKVQKIFSCIK
jgi:hypothetical protein